MTEGLSEENRALLDRVWGPALLVGFDATGPAILTPHGLNRLLDAARAEGSAPSEETRALIELAAHGTADKPIGSPEWIVAVVNFADLASDAEGPAPGRAAITQPETPTMAEPNICPWCGEGIRLGEPTGVSDGERMHLSCAAEEMDNIGFDRDMED